MASEQERMADLEARLARLQAELAQKELLVQRLTTRVVTKDQEFALERASWQRQRRKLEGEVKALQVTVKLATKK